MRRVFVVCVAVALLSAVCVRAVVLERYDKYDFSDSTAALTKCSAHTAPTQVQSGWKSGECLTDGTRSSTRLTCIAGGMVKYEQFQSTTTCDNTPSNSLSFNDKSCYSGTDNPYRALYVDCAASEPTAAIASTYSSTQYFNGSSCTIPLSDVDGLRSYSFVNVSGCRSTNEPSSDGGASFGSDSPYTGNFLLADGSALIQVDAVDATCSQWTRMSIAPINSCYATNYGYDTPSVFQRNFLPTGAAIKSPPMAWPPAGNQITSVQCSDDLCSNACRVDGYQRTGLCVKSYDNSSSRVGVSADGKFMVESSYSDSACKTRLSAYVKPLTKAATCKDGEYSTASAPSSASDVSLAELPLPPIAIASFSYTPPGEVPSCNSTDIDNIVFTQPDTCVITSTPVTYTLLNASAVNATYFEYSYSNAGYCSGAVSKNRPPQVLFATQCVAPSSGGLTQQALLRTDAPSQSSAMGVLAGWYSTNVADQDGASAYKAAAVDVVPGKPSDDPPLGPGTPVDDGAASASASFSALVALVAALAFLVQRA